MPDSARWLCLCSAVVLAGCQSAAPNSFSWLPFKSDRVETESAYATATPAAATRRPELPGAEDLNPPAASAVSTAQIDALITDGVKAIQDRRLDDAKTAFATVLDSMPDHAMAHHGLAMIGDLNEQWADAE